MSPISYRFVQFEREIVKYEDLTILAPTLITAPPANWYYLGPVACTPESPERRGLIVKASEPDALDVIVDWRPVFIDIEGGKYSTWRGVPSNPDKYVVVGDVFVTGIEKPTPKQTEGIRAIRKDLIDEVEPNHFIGFTLWTVIFVPGIYIPTGAFVSSPGGSSHSKLGTIRLHVGVEEVE